MTAERFRILVGWVIVIAWVASLVADLAVEGYEVPVALNGAMMLVAGYLFGPAITGRGRDREGDT